MRRTASSLVSISIGQIRASSLDCLSFPFRPRDGELARRARRIHPRVEHMRELELLVPEELRFDAVWPVVAQLAPDTVVLDKELKQQLSRLGLSRRRRAAMRLVPVVVDHASGFYGRA